ncbi:MAG: DUF1330 domain-containing protein [Chloroflexi bacterium]|jgi:uncharacterized protein (DUF1330 family)|nr:DUF1330 domain-containing protein [Chloroflexota bacterium]MBT4073320.1 DUF1330 domain-containing protein [Chloroflexota bacterium]MBT4514568.1 DUF1330 domain-containing protein [Chloroflexota bacterium]MBT5319270.1 DUF1330 domain-containing protein [Chloroflexota bacterium]MBT6682123.1 DUF1330 domain-containing protein [Chloroflexota bacterium]
MAIYSVSDITVKDAEAYKEYMEKAAPLVEKFGGRYLVRGGEVTPGEGGWTPNRVVILEFPDDESMVAFRTSPEYAPVGEIRHRAADTKSFKVEGV